MLLLVVVFLLISIVESNSSTNNCRQCDNVVHQRNFATKGIRFMTMNNIVDNCAQVDIVCDRVSSFVVLVAEGTSQQFIIENQTVVRLNCMDDRRWHAITDNGISSAISQFYCSNKDGSNTIIPYVNILKHPQWLRFLQAKQINVEAAKLGAEIAPPPADNTPFPCVNATTTTTTTTVGPCGTPRPPPSTTTTIVPTLTTQTISTVTPTTQTISTVTPTTQTISTVTPTTQMTSTSSPSSGCNACPTTLAPSTGAIPTGTEIATASFTYGVNGCGCETAVMSCAATIANNVGQILLSNTSAGGLFQSQMITFECNTASQWTYNSVAFDITNILCLQTM